MRALRRRRLHDDILEVPEPALVGKSLARRPRTRHDLDGLVEARLGLVRRNLEASELAVPVTLADTEIEAATGKKVERCRLFREQHWIVPGRNDHRGTQTQCRCAHCQRAKQHQGRGHLVPAAEMMLDRETRMKAKRLGLDVEIEIVEKSAPCLGTKSGSIGLRRTEQTKTHH